MKRFKIFIKISSVTDIFQFEIPVMQVFLNLETTFGETTDKSYFASNVNDNLAFHPYNWKVLQSQQ